MKIPTSQELSEALDYNFVTQEFVLTKDLFLRIFGMDIIIPKGLTTDGASFPFFISVFVKDTDKDVMIWAILHDMIYRTQFLPRMLADMIFAWGLSKTKGKALSYISYFGLRPFGYFAWRSNKKKGLLKFPEAKERLKQYICHQKQ